MKDVLSQAELLETGVEIQETRTDFGFTTKLSGFRKQGLLKLDLAGRNPQILVPDLMVDPSRQYLIALVIKEQNKLVAAVLGEMGGNYFLANLGKKPDQLFWNSVSGERHYRVKNRPDPQSPDRGAEVLPRLRFQRENNYFSIVKGLIPNGQGNAYWASISSLRG